MPPKARFSKEEIVGAALKLIQEQGLEKLTARSLADALEISTKPIFVAFKNMEEVIQECRSQVSRIYDEFDPKIQESQFYSAEKYVLFAKQEPYLFKFRYLEDSSFSENFIILMKKFDPFYEKSVETLMSYSGCSEETAKALYRDVWLYAHGIACLCAFNQCGFTYEEIHAGISEVAVSLAQRKK